MSGYEKEEFYTMQKDNDGFVLISEPDRKAITEEAFRLSKTKKQINYNFQFLNRNGTMDWHNLTANYSNETEDEVLVKAAERGIEEIGGAI